MTLTQVAIFLCAAAAGFAFSVAMALRARDRRDRARALMRARMAAHEREIAQLHRLLVRSQQPMPSKGEPNPDKDRHRAFPKD